MFDLVSIRKCHLLESFLEGRGVEVRPDGNDRLKARCPFPDHPDVTPSFTIYPDESRFHCFGCGRSGDVIRLVQELDGVSFTDACRKLGSSPQMRVQSGNLRHSSADELASAVSESKQEILRQYRWDPERITETSPFDFAQEPQLHFLRLFHPHAVVWAGDTRDSGSAEHISNFKPPEKWMFHLKGVAGTIGPMICPSIFMPGSISRSNENVIDRPFLVIEGDSVIGKTPETDSEKMKNKAGCAAVTRWMMDRLGMRLAAVIDSGNKSLHSWFHMPPDALFKELQVIAEPLGIDAQVMKNPSQPVRFAGAIHEKTGKAARLLYLDLSEVKKSL